MPIVAPSCALGSSPATRGGPPGSSRRRSRQDAWLLTPATESDVFTEAPDRLWEGVVARLGSAYAMLRSMPADPSLN